jgi:hypothetical protein
VVANRADEPVESGIPFRNLEATFLEVGTSVYAVKGYATSFCLAARRDTFRVGADLLGGIDDKVDRIGIYANHELRPLGAVRDRRQVERLVRLIMRAPVVREEPAGGEELHVVTFHLADGTGVSRLLNAATGFVAGGIVVPKPFTAAITSALGGHRAVSTP